MKKRCSLLLLLISCFAVSCGETNTRKIYAYERFLVAGSKNGFEISFEGGYLDEPEENKRHFNYSYKDELLTFQCYDFENQIISERSAILTDKIASYPLRNPEIEKFKEKGWIYYELKAQKNFNGEYRVTHFVFEILNAKLCPIVEAPSSSDCKVHSYIYDGFYSFTVNCKINYAKYFKIYDKAQMMDRLIGRWEIDNRNVFDIYLDSLGNGEGVVNSLNKLKNNTQYTDINISSNDLVYLERDATKYEVSYRENYQSGHCKDYKYTIILDKEIGINFYYERTDLTQNYTYKFVLDKFSIGSNNSNRLD